MTEIDDLSYEELFRIFEELVDKFDIQQLEQCKAFIEERTTTLNEKQIDEYVNILKSFTLDQQKKICERLRHPSTTQESKEVKSKKLEGAKPPGYIEITSNDRHYWVPQLINPDNDTFYSAGSPRNKPWVGDFKTNEQKQERKAKYGAAEVLKQYPNKLKTLAALKAVYQQVNNQFVHVSADEIQ